MLIRRAGIAVLIASSVVTLGPHSAGAVTGVVTGVWWQAQPKGGALPAPPTVPPGGLWVSSNPSGPQAVSAIRFTLNGTEAAPTIKLKVSRAIVPPATPTVMACPAGSSWQPTGATPGAWSSQPRPDCTKGQSAGQLSTDHTTMTFDLSGMVEAGTVDIVLGPVALPNVGPAPPTPTAFDLTFLPVTPADVATTAPSGFPAAASSSLPEPTAAAAGTGAAVSNGLAVTGPALGVGPVAAVAPVTPPALATGAQPATATAPAYGRVLTPRSLLKAARFSTSVRILAGVMLAVLCVWALWVNAVRTGKLQALQVPVGQRRRFESGLRSGSPPPLR